MLALVARQASRQLPLLSAISDGGWQLCMGQQEATSTSSSVTPAAQLYQSCFTRGMATKKAGGTARQNPDTLSRNLGVKFLANEVVFPGHIIVRQRGTKYHAGSNVGLGKDHTIFATSVGLVNFSREEITYPSGRSKERTVVNVVPVNGDVSPAYKELEQEMVARRAVIKRQMLKSRANEAALYFSLPQQQPRTLPITFPPQTPVPAGKASTAARPKKSPAVAST